MEQVFDIVAEPEVLEARNEVTNAIEPLVRELLQKVETELKRLERKEKSLTVKAELQLGRLSHIEERFMPKERESLALTKRSTEGSNELQDLNRAPDDNHDSGKALADQRLLDELNQMKKKEIGYYTQSREKNCKRRTNACRWLFEKNSLIKTFNTVQLTIKII